MFVMLVAKSLILKCVLGAVDDLTSQPPSRTRASNQSDEFAATVFRLSMSQFFVIATE
jgi:hypothetical protein